jgi:hypothetical protein
VNEFESELVDLKRLYLQKAKAKGPASSYSLSKALSETLPINDSKSAF